MAKYRIQKDISEDFFDINQLSRKELAPIVSRLAAAANKRIKRLEDKGMRTLAYQSVMESGGKFSVKGKNLNELRAEYMRAKLFLESKTSTIKGAKEVEAKFQQLTGYTFDKNQADDFWNVMHELQKADFDTVKLHYKEIASDIADMIFGKESSSFEELIGKAKDKLNEKYGSDNTKRSTATSAFIK